MEPNPTLPDLDPPGGSPTPCPDPSRATVPARPGSSAHATLPGGPPAATGAGPAPPAALGRYQILRELGRGGMGVVYLACDAELKREVALKLLPAGEGISPEQVARFHREAEAAAKLAHPHIVATYDVGRLDGGQPFFTMECVSGGSVAGLLGQAGRLPPIRAMEIVREAAEAVHHAHAHGVIHRDLKPENLLLDADGHVKVSDFGLARILNEPGTERLTRTGVVMGTPAHMSPEQADGAGTPVDARSDVYSLGSVLYELTTGQAPFAGGTPMEVIYRKLSKDPPAPRSVNPNLGADVETIILKALEREPERRYATAADLARDLERCRAGEAIQARPSSRAYRVRKWVGRNRAVSAALGLALAVLLAGGTWVGREQSRAAAADAVAADERRKAAESARRSEERRQALIVQLRNVSALSILGALQLRRRGFAGGEAAPFVAALERAFEEVRREVPDLAEPWFHLGRMRRAQLQWAEALRLQDEALARDPRHAPARYERAVLTVRAYLDRLTLARDRALARRGAQWRAEGKLHAGGGAPGGGFTLADLEQAEPELAWARHEATDAIAAAQAELAAAPAWKDEPAEVLRVGPARLACLDALAAAYVKGNGEAALARLDEAVCADPTLEEAHEAAFQIRFAQEQYAEAAEACTRALEGDLGYVPHWLNRGNALARLGHAQGSRGEDPAGTFARAVADFDRAAALDPANPLPWHLRGQARVNACFFVEDRGQDPVPLLQAAVADYDRVLELDPKHAGAWQSRGGAKGNWAMYAMRRGEDAGPRFEDADADLSRGIELAPDADEGWIARGGVRVNWGNFLTNRGRDPRPTYAEAIEDLTQALERNPSHWLAWVMRGGAHAGVGFLSMRSGQDPAVPFAAALADYRKAQELRPDHADTALRMAQVRGNWGAWTMERGGDASAQFAEAVTDFGRALALNPSSPEAYSARGTAHMNLGLDAQRRGVAPDAHYEAALADHRKALELNPRLPEAHQGLGQAQLNWGNARMARGEDAAATFEAGLADLERALAINPRAAETWLARGLIWSNWGFGLLQRGQDAGDRFERARADFGRALEINPAHPVAWSRRALAGLNAGLQRMARGEDPVPGLIEAIADGTRALELNPNSVESLVTRGLARANQGLWRQGRKEDPVAAYEAAVEDFGRALALHPGLSEALTRRGWVRIHWGNWCASQGQDSVTHFRAALQDLRESMKLDPSQAAVGQWIESIEAALGR